MTQRETLNAIRACGMAARYSAEWGEYRVTFPPSEMTAERREAVAYYTPDSDDALGAAHHMRRTRDEHKRTA